MNFGQRIVMPVFKSNLKSEIQIQKLPVGFVVRINFQLDAPETSQNRPGRKRVTGVLRAIAGFASGWILQSSGEE